MESQNTHRFRTSIDERTASTTVTITADRIMPKRGKIGRKKAPRTHALIVGFDTEYQSHEEIGSTKEDARGVKNEILSYQFCVRLIERDASDNKVQCSGIIIPQDLNRLTLADFISTAIGAWSQQFPDKLIPTDVWLVGHFTRADLPMFHEFEGDAKRSLNNVRNTFVSIENTIPLYINDETASEIAEFRVKLRDTILLAPANAKKLEDVGEMLNFPKIELAPTRAEERQIKQQMKRFRSDRWERFVEYAIRDAEICTEYAEVVARQYLELFGDFDIPVTLTSFGTKLVLNGWNDRGWDQNDVLGREAITVRRFSKKNNFYIKKVETPFIEDIHFEMDFVTETYHGGRNEQFLFGICDEGIWRDHDLSSAYTTAMSLIKKPNWSETIRIDDIDQIEMLDLAYAQVEFEFPESVRFPTLPVRSPNGILFPRTGTSCCAAPEIALGRSLGANLKLKRGLKVPIESHDSVFSDFITGCINKRSEHAKETFKNQFWKEVGNSTYGKTAQGLRKKRVYDLRADDMVELPESKLTQPFFASFITSYTRAVLGEILNRFPESVHVFSVTTDGFLSNATDTDIEHATKGPLFQSFKAGRQNLVEDDQVLEVKHTIKQPLGWRTRGSATLKAGDGSKNIVLQKGGIKSAADLTVEEENARVVRLFFNREPGQTQNYTSAVGLKDLIRYGSDFIFRSVTKRLSMEFDWKRMPVDPIDQTIEFEGEEYTHLSFATKPLENLKQFQSIRDAWEKWGDKPPRVVKSVPDLHEFLTYLSVGRKSNESASKYLHTKDGDLKRLRRDLALAFRNHQAGFAKIRRRIYIPQNQFAEILNAAQVPCKKTDVENARGKFKPYQTPPSDRVLAALGILRDRWPELEVDQFLVQQTQRNSLAPESLSQAFG